MGGAAPEVDAAGNIWVATGNGSSSIPYDCSDSVLELSPGLARTQYFAPSTWQGDNSHDLDLGSRPPALLANGTALQVGQVVDRLPPEPGLARRHRRLRSAHPSAPAAPTPTAGTPSRAPSSTSPAARGAGDPDQPVATALADGAGAIGSPPSSPAASCGRSTDHPLRAQPRERASGGTGLRGRRGQPLPDAVRGRRPAAGPIDRSGLRLHRFGRPSGTPVTGSGRPGELVVLARRIRRRHLQFRQRGLLRLGGQPPAEQARRGDGAHGVEERLLARRLRRRHLHLRRCDLPRVRRR